MNNISVTGSTLSPNFPIVNPPVNKKLGDGYGGYASQFTPSGAAFVYSTFFGGAGDDAPFAIAVDSSSNVYITGSTSSTNFKLANPIQPTYEGGISDA